MLDADPLWYQHSGGDMRQGTEWGPSDRARAEAFYASLRGYTKLFFDLLMDHPGERIDADQITAYFAQHRHEDHNIPNRLSIAGSLRCPEGDPIGSSSERTESSAGKAQELFPGV